jgi:hypothetical protein
LCKHTGERERQRERERERGRLRYTNEERDTNKNSVRRHSASNCGKHRGTKTKVDRHTNTHAESEREEVSLLGYTHFE